VKQRRNRLDRAAVRVFDDAQYWARYMLDHGLADDFHIYPNQPLTASQRRDALALIRAIDRLFASDPVR